MSLLDDIGDYLSSGSTGLSGTVLLGRLSDAPAEQVAVAEYGGFAPMRAMSSGPGTALLEHPRIQVLSRSASYASAKARIKQVEALLDGLSNRTINGTLYHFAAAVQPPFIMRYDELNRAVLAQNYDVFKARTTG